MEKELNLSVLDKKRRELLPQLKKFKNKFYLAGGTALALQIGHRRSDDFNFFSFDHFEIETLQKKYKDFEKSVYLKSLLSYDDIEITPIQYLKGKERKPEEIFSFIEKQTHQFLSGR